MNLKFKLAVSILLFLLFVFSSRAKAQQVLPKNWEKTVVMIEKEKKNNDGTIDTVPHGTGFILEDQNSEYFLITNRHLLKGKSKVFLRYNKADFDPKKDKVRYYRESCHLIDKNFKPLWKGHPNDTTIDVAAMRIQLPTAILCKLEYSRLKSFESLEVGEDVYFFGYPFGILGLKGTGDFPILRSGVISYKFFEPTLIGNTRIDSAVFLIDGFSFGGNSGSPVLTRVIPSAEKKAALVGIISDHLQNLTKYGVGKDTITIEQNIGLAIAISADRIKETLEQFRMNDSPGKK